MAQDETERLRARIAELEAATRDVLAAQEAAHAEFLADLKVARAAGWNAALEAAAEKEDQEVRERKYVAEDYGDDAENARYWHAAASRSYQRADALRELKEDPR